LPKEHSYIIKVYDWVESLVPDVSYAIHRLAGEKYEGDEEEAFKSQSPDEEVPHVGIIRETCYQKESIKKGETVEFYFDEKKQKEIILHLAKKLPVKSVKESNFDLHLEALGDTTLETLFLADWWLAKLSHPQLEDYRKKVLNR
jgi:hypothetical protein